MGILQRYLWREMAANFLGVTLVLFAILFVYQIGAVLARAAELHYPHGMVFELFALGALQNVAVLLPFGLLLGTVLALGRMYHESELTAAQACGFGLARLYLPLAALALPVSLLALWLNLALAPAAAAREDGVRARALRAGLALPLEAGRFRSLGGGSTVVYARNASADGELHDVFIKRGSGRGVEVTTARSARRALAPDGATQLITLHDGERHEGQPGSAQFRIVRFREQQLPVVLPALIRSGRRIDQLPTAALWRSGGVRERAELQWRLGLPVMGVVLSLCAVPLARLRPRQGRYARVWLAVLLFALYANLASAVRVWMERGMVSADWGLWYVHALFALAGVALLLRPRLRRWQR
ncbi:MAG: LPS export ABC transporter permease LptF [Gammaproteobacteria bacterium]|nr:LPS export ABC transporter permease LptF [Gammaproteobacteria bacterium]